MLKQVVYGALFVSNQDEALAFYTNTLGFEKRFDNPTPDGARFVTVGLPGHDFMLVLWPGVPGKGQSAQGRVPGTYTIETTGCRKAFKTLKEQGVAFDPPAVLEHPWGLTATLLDPDGNRITLREARQAAR